jgi:hypothetical protein
MKSSLAKVEHHHAKTLPKNLVGIDGRLLYTIVGRLKHLGVVAERSEVPVCVTSSHRMIANQDGSDYSMRCSAANAVYREGQWQRRSKHTELES